MAIEGGSFDSLCGLSQDFRHQALLTPAERLNFDLGVVKAGDAFSQADTSQQDFDSEGDYLRRPCSG